MEEIELTNLLVIVAVGFAAPFLLGLGPGLRLPAVGRRWRCEARYLILS